MKRKLAVCANGWSMDALARAVEGFRKYAEKEDFDIFVFISFASYSVHKTLMQGELNIYNSCRPEEYDGIVIFSSMMNSDETVREICARAKEKNVPVVSIGMEMRSEGVSSIHIGNEAGMRGIVTHLIEDHGVKDIFFMGGTEDHVDSRERLEVTRKVMEEHGLSLKDEDVGYGKWSNKRTVDALEEMLEKRKKLPEAIVCANDIMALAVCTELERRGIRVPQEVAVTGFDDTENGRIFYPALTTALQDYEVVAKKACELIYKKKAKKEGPQDLIVPAVPVIAESCGCKKKAAYTKLRHLYCSHSFQRNNEANLLEQNERVMRERISDVTDYEDMIGKLRHHYRDNHQFEGSAFYLVLNGEYFKNVTATEQELCKDGLQGTLDVVVAIKNDEPQEIYEVPADQLIPAYEKKENVQHVFFLCPLHYFENNYGYVVFRDRPMMLNETMMYPYLEKLMQSLRLLRVNLRLKYLYDKDPLTGLYNRLGYENKALPLYEKSLQTRSELTVLFVDINSMKGINDHYGHEQGDNAIRTVAQAISDTLQKDWVAVRFGGDEFLVIVPDCDRMRAAQVRQQIRERLQQRKTESGLPYQLTVSIGYVTTDPKKRRDASLKDYVSEADSLMYQIKKEMHSGE
ncbi:MAG: GGDEF domain-containing protein [Lachnospiraceae bacterium]|nr:GGDEF domain-containing protein [Lachnospiraceae bacterium]